MLTCSCASKQAVFEKIDVHGYGTNSFSNLVFYAQSTITAISGRVSGTGNKQNNDDNNSSCMCGCVGVYCRCVDVWEMIVAVWMYGG